MRVAPAPQQGMRVHRHRRLDRHAPQVVPGRPPHPAARSDQGHTSAPARPRCRSSAWPRRSPGRTRPRMRRSRRPTRSRASRRAAGSDARRARPEPPKALRPADAGSRTTAGSARRAPTGHRGPPAPRRPRGRRHRSSLPERGDRGAEERRDLQRDGRVRLVEATQQRGRAQPPADDVDPERPAAHRGERAQLGGQQFAGVDQRITQRPGGERLEQLRQSALRGSRHPPPLPGGRPQVQSIGGYRRKAEKPTPQATLSTSGGTCGQLWCAAAYGVRRGMSVALRGRWPL